MAFTIRVLVLRLVSICIYVAILSGSVFSWNRPGHMLVAAVAYADLMQRDAVAAKTVAEILWGFENAKLYRQAESQYPLEQDPRLRYFMAAARWPDDVRGTSEHRDTWHYINIPFKPNGQPPWVRTKPAKPVNVNGMIREQIAILRSTTATAIDKGRAMCWLFHLVGDIHQPLHTSALFTTNFPNGDLGGNLFFVRPGQQERGINLHKYWDDSVIGTDRANAIKNYGIILRRNIPRSSLPSVGMSDINIWQRESYDLAVSAVYLQGDLTPSTTQGRALVVPEGYNENMKTVAEKRIMLAGYRLSDILAQIY